MRQLRTAGFQQHGGAFEGTSLPTAQPQPLHPAPSRDGTRGRGGACRSGSGGGPMGRQWPGPHVRGQPVAPPVLRRNRLGACTGPAAPGGGPQGRRAHLQPMQGAPRPAYLRRPTASAVAQGRIAARGRRTRHRQWGSLRLGASAVARRGAWCEGHARRPPPPQRQAPRPGGGAAGVGGRRRERRAVATRATCFGGPPFIPPADRPYSAASYGRWRPLGRLWRGAPLGKPPPHGSAHQWGRSRSSRLRSRHERRCDRGGGRSGSDNEG